MHVSLSTCKIPFLNGPHSLSHAGLIPSAVGQADEQHAAAGRVGTESPAGDLVIASAGRPFQRENAWVDEASRGVIQKNGLILPLGMLF